MSSDSTVHAPPEPFVHDVVAAGSVTAEPPLDGVDAPSAAPFVTYPEPFGSSVPAADAVDRVELIRIVIAEAVA